MEDKPPDSRIGFHAYKEEVIKLVDYVDKTFSVDPGRVGQILSKPLDYFFTLRKLKRFIYAKVNEGNLSISGRSQLKGLRECLVFRLNALDNKLLPLGFD